MKSLLDSLTRHMLSDEIFYHKCQLAGIRPEDWPPTPTRQVALEFTQIKSDHGFAFARHKLLKRILALPGGNLPADMELLKKLYTEKLGIHRAEMLALKLQAHPDKADQLISDYMSRRSDEVKVTDLFESLPGLIRTNETAHKEGKSVRVGRKDCVKFPLGFHFQIWI